MSRDCHKRIVDRGYAVSTEGNRARMEGTRRMARAKKAPKSEETTEETTETSEETVETTETADAIIARHAKDGESRDATMERLVRVGAARLDALAKDREKAIEARKAAIEALTEALVVGAKVKTRGAKGKIYEIESVEMLARGYVFGVTETGGVPKLLKVEAISIVE